MKRLNYETLKDMNYDGYVLEDAPERILQFGEGNFLRAFVDYFVDVMNEKVGFNSKIVVCQPIEAGLGDMMNEQEGLYTLYMRGSEKGEEVTEKRLISCVSRCINPYHEYDKLMEIATNPELRYITCNTTEAGIVFDPSCKLEEMPPSSYPAKLTQFLYKRFQSFEKAKGFVILSCELIDNNGKELERCVLEYAKLWNLGDAFITWIQEENIFCSTLVDRIVTGYPRSEVAKLCEEQGYEDKLIVTSEIFSFWVIEGPVSLASELPFKEAGLPVIITENHTPYKQRKVRILNGAHTSMVLGAYLAGQNIVRDCMKDEVICGFMNKTINDEIMPTLTLPKEEIEEFAASVADRFNNPFIDHELLAISLNSTSKWKARVLPSLKGYVEKFATLPNCIVASFAFYIAFYRGVKVVDDKEILDFYFNHKDDDLKTLVHAVCTNEGFFGEDLTKIQGFEEMVFNYLTMTIDLGAYETMKVALSK